jgi:hypothetical protein
MSGKKYLRRGYILMWVLLSCSLIFMVLSAKTRRSMGLLRRSAFSVHQEQQLLAAHSANYYICNRMSEGFIIPADGFLFATDKLQVLVTKQDQQILCAVSSLNESAQGKKESALFHFSL